MGFPKYVKLSGDGYNTCMRMSDKKDSLEAEDVWSDDRVIHYYRDAGQWDIAAIDQFGVIIAISEYQQTDQLTGLELVEISKEEWQEDNYGHV